MVVASQWVQVSALAAAPCLLVAVGRGVCVGGGSVTVGIGVCVSVFVGTGV